MKITKLSISVMGFCVLMIMFVFGRPAPVQAVSGLVIRGGTCSVEAFKSGADFTEPNQISGLSVNCTSKTNTKADYKSYVKSLPQAVYCVSTWESLVATGATVQTDPTRDNRLHCLVSGNVNKIVGKLTRYP